MYKYRNVNFSDAIQDRILILFFVILILCTLFIVSANLLFKWQILRQLIVAVIGVAFLSCAPKLFFNSITLIFCCIYLDRLASLCGHFNSLLSKKNLIQFQFTYR